MNDGFTRCYKTEVFLHLFSIKSRSTGRPLMSSTTELTGLVPGVGVLLFEADS